jgi:predicted transcriptional regulator
MTHPITIRLPEAMVAAMDQAAAERGVPRTVVAAEAVEAWLKERREQKIEAAYRAGYGAAPQEDHVGEAGFEALRESMTSTPRSGQAA